MYSAVGKMDTAFHYVEKSCEDRDFWLFTMKHGPEWDFMRADKRFNKFLERMNFPEKVVAAA